MPQPPQEIKISAYLLWATCALNFCMACSFFFVWVGAMQGYGEDINPSATINLAVVAFIYTVALLVYGVVGYYLLQLKSWAYTAAIVLAIVGLCIFPPFSTFMAIYMFVLLFRKETTQLFS